MLSVFTCSEMGTLCATSNGKWGKAWLRCRRVRDSWGSGQLPVRASVNRGLSWPGSAAFRRPPKCGLPAMRLDPIHIHNCEMRTTCARDCYLLSERGPTTAFFLILFFPFFFGGGCADHGVIRNLRGNAPGRSCHFLIVATVSPSSTYHHLRPRYPLLFPSSFPFSLSPFFLLSPLFSPLPSTPLPQCRNNHSRRCHRHRRYLRCATCSPTSRTVRRNSMRR